MTRGNSLRTQAARVRGQWLCPPRQRHRSTLQRYPMPHASRQMRQSRVCNRGFWHQRCHDRGDNVESSTEGVGSLSGPTFG